METPDTRLQSLPDDALVMLDPAVEILEAEVDECSLLCHTALEIGMVVPPGEGLLDFVRSLMGKPARVGTLREEYDDRNLIDEMLSSLLARGFASVTSHEGPSAARTLRRAVVIDLDAVASIEELCALWSAGGAAPEVLLRCSRLSDHKATLRELAHRRAAGTLRSHHVVLRACEVRCDRDAREFLVRLGAAVEVDGVEWPAPHGSIPGLAELTHALIASHVIMAPDASILDESIRERCVEWCRGEFVSGLCLRLDPSTITDEERVGVLNAVRALEIVLGDVVVTNMPSDEVLLGNTDRGWLTEDTSDAGRRFRLAYLRWRMPLIKSFEGECLWSQIPEVEDKWVRTAEDLLPNHPELLLLAPGSSIVDVCGGLGRVARRLAPAVGSDGIIISIESRRFLTERARYFAYEGNFTNLQFRSGRAERLPLPDHTVDAAVNEWTGAIWELGLGPTMVKEMARVVRPGGRIAVTHRLAQLRLDALDKPWVQYEQIYQWVYDAFRHPALTIVAERVWGQTVPLKGGQDAALWNEQYMPRLVNPNDQAFPHEDSDRGSSLADVYLTIIAERQRS
jgi:ubiquinone/menaquinone biosynthesis C-methylase UbiE